MVPERLRPILFGIGGISLLFFVLTVNPLLFQSLWENEGKYIFTARHSISEILFYNAKDQSPVYFLLLHFWLKLAGSHEFLLRLPSVCFALLAIVFVYRIGLLLGNRSLGLLSAFFLSLSTLVVGMAQEVKHWTLFLFLSVLTLFFFLRYLQRGKKGDLVGFTLVCLTNIYTCFYSLSNFFAAASFSACLGFVKGFQTERPSVELKKKIQGLSLSFLVLGLASVGQLLQMKGAVDFVNWQGAQWGLPKVFPDFFVLVAKDLIGFSYRGPYDGVWLGIGLFFLVMGLIRSNWKIALLAFLWIVPMLGIGYEMAGKASVRERYFISLIPVCLFMIASGVQSIPRKPLRNFSIVLLAALAIPALTQYYASHRDDSRNFKNEDWRGAIRFIEKRYQKDDVIILIPGRVLEGFMAYSDLPFVLASEPKLNQFLHHQRAWIISVYGDTPRDPNFPLLDSSEFPNLWVKLYDLHPLGDFSPEPAMGSYDFREHLQDAKVLLNKIRGGAIPYLNWNQDGRYLPYGNEVGAWGEGFMAQRWEPPKNLSIPEDLWRSVALTHQVSGGKLRPVIWAHPVVGGTVTISYSNVPIQDWLQGFLGFTDNGVQQGAGPVQFSIRIGGEQVFGTLKANQSGWKDFSVRTDRWRGTKQDVTFEIYAGYIRWRHFCFNAWVDDRAASSIKLRFVGDTMFTRGVAAVIEKHQDPFFPFRKIESWLKGGDITVANLETSISEKGEIVPNKEFYFRSGPQFASVLARAGFDAVSLANNHILDFGPQAALDTIHFLKKQGIEPVGLSGGSPAQGQEAKIVIRNGIRTAFLGYSFVPPQFQSSWVRVPPLDTKQMEKDVREASRRADVVAVLTHWGHEYDYHFESWQQSFARAAIDAGAHVVAGAHPHVVQAVERYRQGVIFYSLGDFVFDMPDDWRRLKSWPALAAQVSINQQGEIKETQLLPVWINEEYQPDLQRVFDAESLWVQDDASKGISYSLAASLKEASLQLVKDKKVIPCGEWKSDRISGPISFEDRWSCLGESTFGVTEVRERSGGVFRDGLLATLRSHTSFELRYPHVPSGKKLEGFYGWTDETLASQAKKAVLLEIFIDGKKKWSGPLKKESGWRNFSIELTGLGDRFHEVVWRIENSGEASHLVFDGWIVEKEPPPAFQRVKTISHSEDPDVLWPKSVKISPDGRYAYVQNLDGLNTMIFDTQTLKKLKVIRHEGKPVETVFTQKGRYAWISYLALIGEKYPPYQLEWTPEKGWDTEYKFPSVVVVLDTKKWQIVRKIGVGVRPKFLAVSPDERYVLVSNWSSDSVSVIDTATYQVVKEIPVGTAPRGIAFSKDGKLAYIAVMRGQSIAVIDLKKLEVLRWIKEGVGEGPRHLVRNRGGDRLYISANWSRKIQIMDLNQEKIIQDIDTGELPRSIVLSPDERFLYVDNYGASRVSIIDLTRGKEVTSLKTAEEPVGIDITPDGRYLWVTNYRSHQIMIFERL